MKKSSLGVKISLGFGLLFTMMLMLGIGIIWNMSRQRIQITRLAWEYIPEVDVAGELQETVNRLMYEMRGYRLTEKQLFYEAARKELAAFEAALDRTRSLAADSSDLEALDSQIKVIADALDEYKMLTQQTVDTTAKLEEHRQALDVSAKRYISNAALFLAEQNKKLKKVLNERQEKIKIINQLVEKGSVTRVLNYKFQALDDFELMKNAVSIIDGISGLLSYLRSITRNGMDLSHIDNTETAAENYRHAMEQYQVEFQRGDTVDEAVLKDFQRQMDETSAIYVESCGAFLQEEQRQLNMDVLNSQIKVTMVDEIISLGNEIRMSVYKAQTTRDPRILEKAIHDFSNMETMFETLKAITLSADDLERTIEIQKAADDYGNNMARFFENWQVLQELAVKRANAGNILMGACKSMARTGMESTKQVADGAVKSIYRMSRILGIGLGAALILGVLAAFFIIKSITGPVKRIISGLRDGAGQVASISAQVSSAGQSMAEGASDQAASIEETASSMEQMASMTRNNAENADQADRLMKDADHMVKDAGISMGQLTQSMAGISKAGEESSRIIRTIDEIAFQTNLLALNAAVEAARAGEAGAGFAVVAHEVRNLATRSAHAAKNTAALIQGIVEQINEGTKQVGMASHAFDRVAESSTKVGTLVSEISKASEEQSNGIDQVNKAVAEMDKVVQQNAANAEESASAAEEMSAQAGQLREHVEDLVMLITGTSGQLFMPDNEMKMSLPRQLISFHGRPI